MEENQNAYAFSRNGKLQTQATKHLHAVSFTCTLGFYFRPRCAHVGSGAGKLTEPSNDTTHNFYFLMLV